MTVKLIPPAETAILLVGDRLDNVMAVLGLFHAAGFPVDVISGAAVLRLSRRIRRFTYSRGPSDTLQILRRTLGDAYGSIVLCDDTLLRDVRDSAWDDDEKLQVLPVNGLKNAGHLFSKIALSRRLQDAGIRTPAYRVAHDPAGIVNALRDFDCPVFVKPDASAGGFGLRLVETPARADEADFSTFRCPALVQEKVEGRLVAVEVYYRNARIVFFARSEILACIHGPYGPSSLRRYYPSAGVDARLVEELTALGRALDANGFANVTLIETVSGEHYYIEADMRPNGWVGVTRILGDDPVDRVRDYFRSGRTQDYQVFADAARSPGITVPHFNRASLYQMLLNRHDVWAFVPWNESVTLLAILTISAAGRQIGHTAGRLIRRVLGERAYWRVRQVYRHILQGLMLRVALLIR